MAAWNSTEKAWNVLTFISVVTLGLTICIMMAAQIAREIRGSDIYFFDYYSPWTLGVVFGSLISAAMSVFGKRLKRVFMMITAILAIGFLLQFVLAFDVIFRSF
jgi:hypothetical protein